MNAVPPARALAGAFIMASAAKSEVRFSRGKKNSLDPRASPSTSSCTWNAIYMQKAIQQLRLGGTEVRNDDVSHLSPLI